MTEARTRIGEGDGMLVVVGMLTTVGVAMATVVGVVGVDEE